MLQGLREGHASLVTEVVTVNPETTKGRILLQSLHKNYARLVAELALGVEVFKHGIPETKSAKTAAAF